VAAPGAAARRSVFLDHRDLRPVMTDFEWGANSGLPE